MNCNYHSESLTTGCSNQHSELNAKSVDCEDNSTVGILSRLGETQEEETAWEEKFLQRLSSWISDNERPWMTGHGSEKKDNEIETEEYIEKIIRDHSKESDTAPEIENPPKGKVSVFSRFNPEKEKGPPLSNFNPVSNGPVSPLKTLENNAPVGPEQESLPAPKKSGSAKVDKSDKESISKANTHKGSKDTSGQKRSKFKVQKFEAPKIQKSEASKTKTKKLEIKELPETDFIFYDGTFAKFGAEFLAARKRKDKPKKKRLTVAELKKGFEHVTKDVPKDERLSDKELLDLGKKNITKVQRWVEAPYAWNFRGALLGPYYRLALVKISDQDGEYYWDNKDLKGMGFKNPEFFRERLKYPNLYAAKGGLRRRPPPKVTPKRDDRGRYHKAASTTEGRKISEATAGREVIEKKAQAVLETDLANERWSEETANLLTTADRELMSWYEWGLRDL